MAKNLLNSMNPEERARAARWSRQAYSEPDDKKKPVKIFRPGKTAHDRNNKAAEQQASNRQARVDWQHGTGHDAPTLANFPWHTCNGKKNRRQITGRGATTINIERIFPR